MKKIIVTGGDGRFGKIFKKFTDNNYIFPSKKAVSASVEVAELITKIAEGLFFKTK